MKTLLSIALWFSLVSSAQAAPPEVTIAGERVFPESITSTRKGDLFFSSITGVGIYRAEAGSTTATLWIPPQTDGLQATLGVLADETRNVLWVCSALSAVQGQTPPPSALHAFDLKTGAPTARYPLPTAGALCNDIAIGADGTVYVTDSTNMEISRLHKGTSVLEVWATTGKKGDVLDGIAIIGNRVFTNTYMTGKLYGVPIQKDGRAGTVTEIALPRLLDQPDGMRPYGKDLLVTDGAKSGGILRVKVTGDRGEIAVVRDSFPDAIPGLTVVGSTLYVVDAQLAARRLPPDEVILRPFKAIPVPLR